MKKERKSIDVGEVPWNAGKASPGISLYGCPDPGSGPGAPGIPRAPSAPEPRSPWPWVPPQHVSVDQRPTGIWRMLIVDLCWAVKKECASGSVSADLAHRILTCLEEK
jgi:hypothetical protein